jgi:hypothetical protein
MEKLPSPPKYEGVALWEQLSSMQMMDPPPAYEEKDQPQEDEDRPHKAPPLAAPVQIAVLLDVSGSMGSCDIRAPPAPASVPNPLQDAMDFESGLETGAKITRNESAARLLEKIADGHAMQHALERMATTRVVPTTSINNMNMSMVSFAHTAAHIMSARLVRRCPECAGYEYETETSTKTEERPSQWPGSQFGLQGKEDTKDQKTTTSVAVCSKCNIAVEEFVCSHHPDWDVAGPTVERQCLGSESLCATIGDRARSALSDVGGTNVAGGMAAMGRYLTERGTSVTYQQPVGSESDGQDAIKELLVPSAENKNPKSSIGLSTVVLYIGDDEPNLNTETPYSVMSVDTHLGAKTMVPIVTVQVAPTKWTLTCAMRSFAFRDEVVHHDGSDEQAVVDRVCDLILLALCCTDAHTVVNRSKDEKLLVVQEKASNFTVLPGETLTILEEPGQERGTVTITKEKVTSDALHHISRQMAAVQAGGRTSVGYTRRSRGAVRRVPYERQGV